MRWLRAALLIGCAFTLVGCSNGREETDAEKIAKSFRGYYAAVVKRDYGAYERVALNPMSKDRFAYRTAKISRANSVGDPVNQLTLGLDNKDARIIGVSPWTARDVEFRVRKIGNEFKIVE